MKIEKAIVNYESSAGAIAQFAQSITVEKEWLVLEVDSSTIFVPRDRVLNIIKER